MSERYKKLYHLEHRLHAAGSPVVLDAGALLLDQLSNAMLCQLRFRCIQSRPVKALRAEVQMLDAEGKALGKPVDHRYQELELTREKDYGRDTAIVLPSREARSFTVRLSQVSFADGEVWTDEGSLWLPLPDELALDDCADTAAVEHFRSRFGEDARFAPTASEELWFCTCGAVNGREETRCPDCRRRRDAQLSWAGGLRPGVQTPPHPAEEEPEDDSPRIRPGRLIVMAAAALIVLAGLFLLPRLRTPASDPQEAAYTQAMALAESGDLSGAQAAFAALGDYRDSAEYAQQHLPYWQALALQEQARQAGGEEAVLLYRQAAEIFAALDGYGDAALRANDCLAAAEELTISPLQAAYNDAAALMSAGQYRQAQAAFALLGDYLDSAEQVKEALYRRAMALYRFVQNNTLAGIRAQLPVEPEGELLFSLPREKAMSLGGEGLAALQAACGGETIRFITDEEGDRSLLPLEEAVAGLFAALGDYKDSAELAEILPEMVDRSDEFFALCAQGELAAARDWLTAYDRDFEGRETWQSWLELYLPFCGDWELSSGDPSLIPMIQGRQENHYSIHSFVTLDEEGPQLHLLTLGDSPVESVLNAGEGEVRFLLHGEVYSYLAELNARGHLTVIKLNQKGTQGGADFVKKA